ncbi:Nst1 protein [Candida orthopsilosis Co 90-125]|uniref:Stress response protein NST1 n=1 Tax=Candida orthopsilosis (strain 90-125) TaxID=1136231 RepID=H8X1F1_CANO9|nr:Nst1 protein [Candida orthopsilosis Co 90-125]CCG22191.1 Nst1 protein [Candida orthopsilosis Co 90-125]
MSDRVDTNGTNTKFRVGDNVHFEVSNGNTTTTTSNNTNPSGNKSSNSRIGNATAQATQQGNSSSGEHDSNSLSHKAKKKKRSKGKKTTRISTSHAHLNNPDEDYPTSRVIKQAPNGDVIVESLEDEESDGESEGSRNSHSGHRLSIDKPHSHSHPHKHHDTLVNQSNMASTVHSVKRSGHDAHSSLWDSASIEEQEKLKEFWESLAEPQKLELVKIDKESIMKMFKNETRQHLQQLSQQQGGGNSNGNSSSQNNCTCKYCGRRNHLIEEELESIYDNHFDDIIDFIHEVRDINDLNALPGLLFGGFHMLEEERKLQRRKQLHSENQEMAKRSVAKTEAQMNDIKAEMERLQMASAQAHPESLQARSSQQPQMNQQPHPITRPHTNVQISASIQTSNSSQTQLFDKLLDPKLFQALEGLDLQKMKETAHLDPKNAAHLTMLEKAGSLKEIVRDLQNHDGKRAERGAKYVQNMGKFFSNIANMKASSPEEAEKYMAKQFTEHFGQGLSTFAEDLLNNDGNSFINMMESLTESRTAREDALKGMSKDDNVSGVPSKDSQSRWVDEDDEEEEHEYCAHHHHHHHHHHDAEGYEVDDDDEYDYEYDDEEEEDDDFEEGEAGKDVSDTESEISEEEKMQEIRRLFLIQVIKLFQERLKSAYKEKVSKDNTQKLIEELEAEEKAKKEREAKKLKQKEKAKEKKRLAQLAKEEEKKKREEEARKAEEENRAKQEEQRAEQKRRKEEARQKREEERKRKAEEAKRREEEHRKKIEAQQKKDEEAKRLKEERRKRAEQERKQKEEENKRKEALKKQKDEEKEKERIARAKQAAEQDEAKSKRSLNSANTYDSRPSLNSADAYYEQDLAKRIEEERLKFFTDPGSSNNSFNQQYQPRPGSLSSRGSSVGLTIGQLHSGVPSVPQQPQFASDFTQNQYLNQASVLSPPTATTSLVNGGSAINPSLSGNLTTTAASTAGIATGNHINPMSPWLGNSGLNQNPVSTFLPGTNSSIKPNLSATNIQQQGQPTARFDPFGTSNEPTEPVATAANAKPWSTNPNAVNTGGMRSTFLWNNNGGPTTGEPLLNSNLKTSSLYSSDIDQNKVNLNVGIPTGLSANSPTEVDLIQSSTVACFQSMANMNQLEFGVAPLMKLFEEVKSVANRPQLSVDQFLNCCQSGSVYQFEKKYDPFGRVTHMKVGSNTFARTSPPVAQLFASGAPGFAQSQSQSTYPQQPSFQRQESFGPGGFAPPGIRKTSSPGFTTDPPLMSLRSDMNPKSTTSGFVDGLWNN